MFKVFFSAIALLLVAHMQPALADIHKCVNTNGTISYTDQPCAVTNGEKSVDSSVSALDRQNKIGHSCADLDARRLHCGQVYPLLLTTFRDNCVNPMQQYQHNLQQYHQVNRYQSAAERNADAIPNNQQKSISEYRCESMQRDTWAFLKENFGKKITEHDSKDIDYHIQAIPDDGQDARKIREGMRD
jgi:hypothetical protein